tara:strand:+ start:836 stop:1558 length:723 start_codon:yes stop_codon:yes gene_type:complete
MKRIKKKNEKIIAIIPARGGSKRIKNKNLINFFGKPIIHYSLELALNSKIFDKVFVSTDSIKIVKTVKKNKVDVPFLRSKKNSSDNTTIKDVLLEVLYRLKKNNQNYKYCCCIYPTSVFLDKKQILKSFKKLKKDKLNSILTISKYENKIQRSLQISRNGLIKINQPKYINKMSQKLKDNYFDSGQFFWIKIDSFLKSKKIIGKKTGSIILPNILCQDINTYDDLEQAKIKYSYLKSLKK